MPNPYTDAGFDLVDSFYRIHANSEQTHVAVLQVETGAYVAVAYDVDPREYRPVAGEAIAYGPTKADVAQRAERWMETHPKGIADGGGSGGGIGSRIMAMLKRLNDYGNTLMDDQQQGNQQ